MDNSDLRKPIILGGINGLILGLFMIFLILLGDVAFSSFIITIILFGAVIFIPPILIGDRGVSLGILFPISFLTFIFPLFGVTLGLPNSSLFSLLQLLAISGMGGLFWGGIFSIGIFFYRKFKS